MGAGGEVEGVGEQGRRGVEGNVFKRRVRGDRMGGVEGTARRGGDCEGRR